MEWKRFWILFCMIEGMVLSRITTVEYLFGGPRIEDDSYFDYYFCCNTRGQFLEVRVDGELVAIFSKSQSGAVSSGNRPSFMYLVTLLSVKETDEQGIYQFDSVSVVSQRSEQIISVSCESDLSSSSHSATNNKLIFNNFDVSRSGNVSIQPLFANEVVRGSHITTFGFVCYVKYSYPTWSTDDQQDLLEFNSFNSRVGDRLPTHLRNDSIAWPRLATICVNNNDIQIVTLLFLTGIEGMRTVTCSGRDNSISLPIRMPVSSTSPPATSAASSEGPVSSTSPPATSAASSEGSALEVPILQSGEIPLVVILVSVTVSVASFIIMIITIFILKQQKWRRRKLEPGQPQRPNTVETV